MKSDKLREKMEQAELLEELLNWAHQAESYITDILCHVGEFNIQEPHGWLSSIINDLINELEEKLEEL
jgi:hypothetical protein